jgi:excisionase family DNA binding protein
MDFFDACTTQAVARVGVQRYGVIPSRNNALRDFHWTTRNRWWNLGAEYAGKELSMPDDRKPPESEAQGNRLPKDLKEPLLDSRQAAAILKVHPRTVQRLVHRGKIHAIHVGKLWRFRASALEAWMDS